MSKGREFYEALYPHVVQAMKEEGIDPAWAPITTSQAMIETSWGKSPATAINNFFGMKAAPGQKSRTFSTREGYGKNTVRINDAFLAFPSLEEGVRAGVRRLKDKFRAFEGTPSAGQYVRNLNRNPKALYFTGDPELYERNLAVISGSPRAVTAHRKVTEQERRIEKATWDDYANNYLSQYADNTAVTSNAATKAGNTMPVMVNIPDGNYVQVRRERIDPAPERARNAFEAVKSYNRLASLFDFSNASQPSFEVRINGNGGSLKGTTWDSIPMKQKSEVINLAVQNGIYDLDTIRNAYNEFASGGSIHIDPSKKGTFTAAASKHGKSVQEFASQVLAHPENYSPAMRKKANFARNASKWKHGLGGNLFAPGGEIEDEEYKYATTYLPEVTITAPRQYVERYDKSGNPVYTTDPTKSMGYNAPVLQSHKDIQEALKEKPNTGKQWADLATQGIGLALAPIAAAPVVEAGLPIMNTMTRPLTTTARVGSKIFPSLSKALPYTEMADRGIMGYMGARGAYDTGKKWYNGEIPWYQAVPQIGLEGLMMADAAPLGRLAKPVYERIPTLSNYIKTSNILGQDGRLFNSKIVRSPENFYRAVGKKAIQDAEKTGVIRGNQSRPYDPYPFFGRSTEPYDTYPYVIEGTPESADWISTYKYAYSSDKTVEKLPTVPDMDFSKAYSTVLSNSGKNGATRIGGFDREFLEKYEALPMYKGSVNAAPTYNFSYWKKYPLFGWRKKSFRNAVSNISKKPAKKPDIIWDAEQMFKDGNNFSYTQKDIDILNSFIPEYKEIEKLSKANGTYLKMPDGSTWKGDPREWVIAQSKNVKDNYGSEILTHGNSDSWITKEGTDVTGDILGEKTLWTSTNPYLGGTYGNKRYRFVVPKDAKVETVADAHGRYWRDVKPGVDTNMMVYPNLTEDKIIRINNVVDRGPNEFFKEELPKAFPKEGVMDYTARVFQGDDLVLGNKVRRKALLGNNGMFDINNPNIFKGLIPAGFGIAGYKYSKSNENK